MLKYTTQMRRLILPEYGRNIQNMVDHCLTLADREQRTACAHSIIKAMKVLVPAQGAPEDYERKLWDHLMIMSGFALDVDLPEGVASEPKADEGPEPVALARPSKLPYRHYGLLLNQAIDIAANMEPGDARDELVVMLANQMKKTMLAYNPDGVEDERIFSDLMHMSHGVLRLDSSKVMLNDYRQAAQPGKRKKRKK